MACNTAIFYDIENLTGLFSGKANTVLHLDEIYRRVLEMDGVEGVSIQRAYADWILPLHRNLRNSVLQVGIEQVQIFNTNQNDRVKNAADVSLIIDAVDLAARRPDIKNFVIASGDGIFAFLAKKLHEHGKRVIGCSFDRITNNIFRNSCDFFIALEKSDESIVATSTARRKKPSKSTISDSHSTPQESEEAALLQKIPHKFPKSKYSEVLHRANIPIWQDAQDTSGCIHTIRKLVDALFVEETKGLPSLEVSVFMTYVSHYIPEFKVTRHGFKRFGEFMRFILTGSPYCLLYVSDNVVRMAPRSAASGTIMDDIAGILITTEDGSRYNSIFSIPADEQFVFTISTAAKAKPKAEKAKPKTERIRQKAVKVSEKAPESVSAVSETEAEAPAPKKRGRRKKEVPVTDTSAIVVDEGSIRKWIKVQFEELASADVLPLSEVKRLTTSEYSLETFGIRTPVLREIETRSNLTEQRTINGRVKYWKDSFKFNGRTYLVYKEWVVGLHKDRFVAWLAAKKPKS